MQWETLNSEQQFLNLLETEPKFAVFKHSTRCSISTIAKNRVERDWDLDFPVYFLDLLRYRSVSDLIEKNSNVEHQSPQLIVFHKGKVVYDASHSLIVVKDLKGVPIN